MSLYIAPGDVVNTPYGESTVVEVRSSGSISEKIILCTPTKWKLAEYSSTQPCFFLNPSDVRRQLLNPGDCVKCAYGGSGEIIEVRPLHYVVILTGWFLATRKSPVLYLSHSSVSLDTEAQEKRLKDIKMKAKWNDCIQKAKIAKEKASSLFREKNFDGAERAYFNALSALNAMGTDLPDSFRAEVLEHTIPCHNNIALCSMKSKAYDRAIAYANNAVMLIEAIEGQISKGAGAMHGGTGERKLSLVWVAFKKGGMTFEKLIYDWKKKSLFFKGKAAYLAQDYDVAIENLAMALAVLKTPLVGSVAWALATCDGKSEEVDALINHNLYINTDGSADTSEEKNEKVPVREKEIKELTDLLALAKKGRKAQNQMWGKALEKSAREDDKEGKKGPKVASPRDSEAPSSSTASVPLAQTPSFSSTSPSSNIDISQYLQKGSSAASTSPKGVNASPSPLNLESAKGASNQQAAESDEDDDDDDDDDEGYVTKEGGLFGFGYTETCIGVLSVLGLAGFALSRYKK